MTVPRTPWTCRMITVELFLPRDDLNPGGATMRARRPVDPIHVPNRAACAIAVAAAVTLLLSASAQAATVSQKAYKIFTTEYKAQLAWSKLPLTVVEHKQAVSGEAYIKRVLAINTAHDMARWQAASYATAKEPA